MEASIIIIVGAILLFLILANKKKPIRQYSDEELKTMSFEEWKELNRKVMASTETAVLQGYLSQYKDLKKRIEEGHKETIEMLSEQDIERSLQSFNTVIEELSRRGEL